MPVCRVFGRALNWVGNGAKTVVQTPLKAKPWQRKQAKAQPVACGATAQLVVQDTSASGGETTLQAYAPPCLAPYSEADGFPRGPLC